jgi:hypothetical protein
MLSGLGAGPFRDPWSFAEIFLGAFKRDLNSFYPGLKLEPELPLSLAGAAAPAPRPLAGLEPIFQLEPGASEGSVRVSAFGQWFCLRTAFGPGLGPRDLDLIRAIGRVMELHYQVLFRASRISLLQLRRGMPEDHHVAACVEPSAYSAACSAPSRISEAILTLRTMALSTYENRRVTTGALILGPGAAGDNADVRPVRPAADGSLVFGVELTGLKTLHRLCDGRRTLFLVDQRGRLADLVDIRQWATSEAMEPQEAATTTTGEELRPLLQVPCARTFMFHALATRTGGHVCLVLSPNQEIKVFAGGVQAFVFAHGRWRVQDPLARFHAWQQAVADPRLARVLFQTALDLAEDRQGGLLVVVSNPDDAFGRLIAPHDFLDSRPVRRPDPPAVRSNGDAGHPSLCLFDASDEPDTDQPAPRARAASSSHVEPLAKQSIHYLARGASVTEMDAAVLEALAGLDGALVTDTHGRLLAFGAILRHDAHSLSCPDVASPHHVAEGARTTAAIVASRFGPVLKVSEDGIVSCFLGGERVWDL